jgi:hypothetical protein
MSSELSQEKLSPNADAQTEAGKEQTAETGSSSATGKKAYKKPVLRKYDQIDYVTAYAVD